MRLIFMGTPEFAVPSLLALLEDRHEILSVVTRPDRPRKHARSASEPSAVKRAAVARGLSILQPLSAGEPDFADRLRTLAPDTIVVVAFGQILPAAVLRIPPRWCINLHASLLPRHRGAAPIAHAILAGDKETGVTTMKIEEGLDTGDILLRRECPIGPVETAGELAVRLAVLGARLLSETLVLLERGVLAPRPQPAIGATYAPSMKKEQGRIDWSDDAARISAQVRACNPWPSAFASLGGRPVQILRADVEGVPPAAGSPMEEPGRIIGTHADRLIVRCGAGTLLGVLELRFPGGRAMSARDALNGRMIQIGDLLAPPSRG